MARIKSEVDVLKLYLDCLDESSSQTKNTLLLKKMMIVFLIIFLTLCFVCFKYALLKTLYLMMLSFLSGMCASLFVFLTQIKDQNNLLKPFIDIDGIRNRIKDLEASAPIEKTEWPE